MSRRSATLIPLGLLAAAASLSACTETRLREAPDFGESVRENVAAQIADPDARYVGNPAPGSNGMRTNSSQERYVRGKVTPPPAATTSQVGGSVGGGGGQ